MLCKCADMLFVSLTCVVNGQTVCVRGKSCAVNGQTLIVYGKGHVL